MKKNGPILLLLSVLFQLAAAQNPFIKNYTITDGLPTNKIIHIFNDSKGFMWFTTDAGVIRFDGSRFVNFSVADGLSDNVVMRMKEDVYGRLWFFNLNGTTNYFYENTIFNAGNAPLLNELKTNFYLIDFFQDTDSTLYFYNSASEVFVVKNNELSDYKNFEFDNAADRGLHFFNRSSDGQFLLWTTLGIYAVTSIDGDLELNPVPEGIHRVFSSDSYKSIIQDRQWAIHFYENEKLARKNVSLAETPFINSLVVDHEGYIWLATYDKGVYCYDNNQIIFHLDIKSAQGLLIDNENNIWITSSIAGIYKINRDLLKFKFLDKTHFENNGITDLSPANNGGIWCTNGESLFLIYNNELIPQKLDIKGNILDNIYQLKNNTIITNGNGTEMNLIRNVIFNPSSKTLHYDTIRKYNYTLKKTAVDSSEQTLYSFTNNIIIKIYLKDKYFYDGFRSSIGRISNTFFNRNNDLIINASRNFLLRNDTLRYVETLAPFNGLTLTSHLVIDKEKELYNFIGNKLILQHNQEYFDITENFRPLIDYRIKDMVYDGSTLFFFTDRTIYFIPDPFKIIGGEPLELNRLNIEFNNLNDMICQNDTLYIASDDGLIFIPVEECINAQAQIPKPYIYKISLDDHDYNFNSGSVEFKNRERLSIEFGSQNYSSFPSNYSYMLKGVDKNWIEGNESRVVYMNLSPGKYTFKLKARKGMETYSEVTELPVIIHPTLFQRTSTKILAALLFFMLIFIIVRAVYKNQIKKKETDSLLITLEHKALQSMMNPHFIFNALGSIQRYLLLNKAEEAGTYLSQFARLIRQNMNSLKSNYICIDDEVERLRNYIELEKFRMNDKFSFVIEVDEKLDVDDVEIPSMVVQPFVENAIWHGISPLNGEGKILVQFNPNDEKSISIVIEDNGIGVKNAKVFSKSDQNLNMGVSITEKRLSLMGERLKINTKIITEDLNPGEQNPGTRVTMVVPILT